MPVYEYECKECGHKWEHEQRISDPRLTKCPACEKESAKRLISSGTSFQLVGGGWFKDGY